VDFVGRGIEVIICGLVVLIKYCGWSVNEFVDFVSRGIRKIVR
jgi:hypothetical protein